MSYCGFDEIDGMIARRVLKLYWLIDVSGSMADDKIASVNRAIRECIVLVREAAEEHPEIEMYMRIMRFSCKAQWHTVETKIEEFEWSDLVIGGDCRNIGVALKLMAQELTIEKMGKRVLPPVIILVTGGEATDDYGGGIRTLLSESWEPRTTRIAIAIGQDVNIDELSKFCSNPKENPPLEAKKASNLIRFIKLWEDYEEESNRSAINGLNVSTNICAPLLPMVTICTNSQGNRDDAIF